MKKLCEGIPCGIWLFTIKAHIHISHIQFAILLYLDIGHSQNIIILSLSFNGTNKSLQKK